MESSKAEIEEESKEIIISENSVAIETKPKSYFFKRIWKNYSKLLLA